FFHNGTGTGTPATTQTVTLNPDGTVPNSAVTGPLAPGSYSYIAVYSGDNRLAGSHSDVEPLTVIKASPILIPTPNVTTVTLGDTTPPILTDWATLSGGSNPTGTITFELFYSYGDDHRSVHDETISVHGNGTYTTPTGLTLPTDVLTSG